VRDRNELSRVCEEQGDLVVLGGVLLDRGSAELAREL
jgi:hypothetical protein